MNVSVGRRVLSRLQAWSHVIVPCALAFLLRLPGVFNGLPYVRHPDEPVNYVVFHRMVADRTPLPHFYDYPSLQYGLQALVHSVVAVAGRVLGAWDSLAAIDLPPGRPGAKIVLNSEPWVVARLVTVAIALVGVALVVVLATRLSGSRRWGAAAGVLSTTSGIGLDTGFVITPDALAGTTAMAVIVMVMRLHGPGAVAADRRWALVTGALLGLAVGAKYNNGALVAAIIGSVALAPATLRPTARHLAQLAAVAAGVFVLTTPGILFDFQGFVQGLERVMNHYSKGHAGFEGNTPSANFGYLWGSDALTLALATVAVLAVRRRHVLLLAGWVVGYFCLISVAKVHFDRNLTPLLGSLAVLGALGAQWLWHRVRSARDARLRYAVAAAVVVVFGPLLWVHTCDRAREVAYQLTDHQAQARTWLTDQLPAGSAVLTDFYSPWLDAERYDLTIRTFVSSEPPEAIAAFPTTYDAVLVTSSGSGRFLADRSRYPSQVAILDAVRDASCRVVRFEDSSGYWIDVHFQRCS